MFAYQLLASIDQASSVDFFNINIGRILSEEEMYELLAAAVFMHVKREQTSEHFLNQHR